MPKRDVQATEAKHFFSPKSYVAKDGREVLFHLDWKQRVGELRQRCGGRCEYEIPYGGISTRCLREAADPDHIIPRSKGRDDRLSNLQGLCRLHHELKHKARNPRWRAA